MGLVVSNFGDDNGSNGKGRQLPASPNGFRLDSSQSSWLMDRLQALSDEDKLSMETARLEARGVAVDQQALADQAAQQAQGYLTVEQTIGQQGGVGGQQDAMSQREVQQLTVGNGPRDGSPEGYSQNPHGHQGHQGNERGNGQQGGSRQLKQKIENLEQKLAEISSMTLPQGDVPGHQPSQVEYHHQVGYEDPSHVAQQGQPYSQSPDPHYPSPQAHYPPHGQDQQSESEHYPEEGYSQEWAGHTGHVQSDYDPHAYSQQAVHPPVVNEGGRGAELAGHESETYGYEPVGDVYPASGMEQDHLHSPAPLISQQQPLVQDAVMQEEHAAFDERQGQEVPANLPQFLAPAGPNKMRRSRMVSVVGGLITLVIVGGVAFNYFGNGVSDVVKSEFGGFVTKEKMQLSEFKNKANSEVSSHVPQVAVLSPADFVGDFWVSKVIGVAGETVPVAVRLPKGNYPSSFVVVRGLPEWASLNKGRLANGAWIVGSADAGGLAIAVPPDKAGVFSFVMEFVHSPDQDPISRNVTAEISKNPVLAGEKTGVESLLKGTSVQPLAGQVGAPINKDLEEKWLQSGARLLRSGDVSGARLAFSHLAEQGSGRGAMAMAMTYDPSERAALRRAGAKPDVKRAKFWYNRALSLGQDKALERLKLLK